MYDDSGDAVGGGEGGTMINSIEKNQNKLGKEIPIKIKKAISDWDNGTGNCVDESVIYFEKNGLNMKVLGEKIGFPILTLEKFLFSDLSKRRVIGDGVGGKSLSQKNHNIFTQQ